MNKQKSYLQVIQHVAIIPLCSICLTARWRWRLKNTFAKKAIFPLGILLKKITTIKFLEEIKTPENIKNQNFYQLIILKYIYIINGFIPVYRTLLGKQSPE